jgi:hypothetical protein
MKKVFKLVAVAALVSLTVFNWSCKKDEEVEVNKAITLSNGELTVRLRGNLNLTDDTNKFGAFETTYNGIAGVSVVATAYMRDFYANPSNSYNFKDTTIAGVTGSDGKVTLKLPVGENEDVRYDISFSQVFVNQIQISDTLPDEKVASTGNATIYINKDEFEVIDRIVTIN